MRVSEYMVVSRGTELPPKTLDVMITEGETNEKSNIVWSILAVMSAYDPKGADSDILFDKILDVLKKRQTSVCPRHRGDIYASGWEN